MVNRDILQNRMEKANEYLDFLEELGNGYSKAEFKKDPKLYGSAERFLHLTIEVLIDIGNHIIADQNLGKVDFYSDIPDILYENNFLEEDLKDIFIKIIGFRNVLVHDYLEVDLDIVYIVMKEELGDIKDILKEYARLI